MFGVDTGRRISGSMLAMSDATQAPESTPTPSPQVQEAIRRTQQRFVTAQTNPRTPSEEDVERVRELTSLVTELGMAIEYVVPEGRDKELALTYLEDVLTRASRAIYIQDPIGGRAPALLDLQLEEQEDSL